MCTSFSAKRGPNRRRELTCFSVATDDIFGFERLEDSTASGTVSKDMSALDEIFSMHSIQIQRAKQIDRQRDCTVLGVEIRDGMWLGARGCRVKQVWSCLASLRPRATVTVKWLSGIVGVLNWHNLLARGLLSCLHRCYGAVGGRLPTETLSLTTPLLTELVVNASLAAFWTVDLCRSWTTLVPFSDASESYGFGLCFGRLRDADVASLSNQLAKWPHHAVFSNTKDDGTLRVRAGDAVRLSIRDDRCRTIFGIRARRRGPPGQLEAQAVALGLQRVLRQVRHHGCRILFGTDAQAVMHALNKGRSSSWSLRREISRCSMLALAGDLRCKYFYVPSELNVADGPSRGKFTRTRRSRRRWRPPAEPASFARLRRSLVRCGLWSQSSDDSRLWSGRSDAGSSLLS